MKFPQVLDCLHSKNPSRILSLLNNAIYAEDYLKDKKLNNDKKWSINTGVTFSIHTGSNFEIIYEPFKQEIIFQKCDYVQLPNIIGLIVTSSTKPFFETYSTTKLLVSESVEGDWRLLNIEEKDILEKKFTHEFQILDSESKIIQSFPLNWKIPFVIYNGRNEFKELDLNDDEDDIDDEDF